MPRRRHGSVQATSGGWSLNGRLTLAPLVTLVPIVPAYAAVQDAPESGQVRTYYIAADELDWDYLPGGYDHILDRPYADSAFFANAEPRPVSTLYRKALFREYTDSTFETLKPRPPEWRHLGFLGPLIRGVVGDTIRVVFRNNASQPHSVHPHGVF